MRLLVVGGGGREHALVWKLQQSREVERIFCAPGNAGTLELGDNVSIQPNDFAALRSFAKENAIDLTVVGPDDPLGGGLVDFFAEENLRIFGPDQSAARLEASKVFAKQIMRCAGIPTAMAGIFEESRKACRFADHLRYPIVVKADGLAAGKGVVIAKDTAAAHEAIREMMDRRRFGAAGARLLIEEYLEGREVSLHVLLSGTDYQLLGTACDHKRLLEGNEGPNTGGMGAYSPAFSWDGDLQRQFDDKIMQPMLRALRDERISFRGLLFPGLMISNGTVRVLEFNCRFGDPETQAILPRLKSDLLPLLQATIDGRIRDVQIEIDPRPAVTVVMCSAGYPESFEKGKNITGLEEVCRMADVQVFHAGTRRDGGILTNGGRVLAVTALGDTLESARKTAYTAVGKIHFEGAHYRGDIALAAVAGNIAGSDDPPCA